MNVPLAIASGLSLLTWGVHPFVGTPEVARPLLQSELEPIPKYTNYYCWHLVTLVLGAMAVGFAYSAVSPSGTDLAAFLVLLAASFAVWSLLLVRAFGCRLIDMPQWSLFTAIAAAGLLGIVR